MVPEKPVVTFTLHHLQIASGKILFIGRKTANLPRLGKVFTSDSPAHPRTNRNLDQLFQESKVTTTAEAQVIKTNRHRGR